MALIKNNQNAVFDTGQIDVGDLIYVSRTVWPEPRKGIVTKVSETELTVLFLPYPAIQNRFVIMSEMLSDGTWTIRWTHDMKTIQAYGEET